MVGVDGVPRCTQPEHDAAAFVEKALNSTPFAPACVLHQLIDIVENAIAENDTNKVSERAVELLVEMQ